ncbi:hypothetical protein [Ruegeria sp. HKCCE4148]|uniref:hypothetical protein n=1 Tax=Ruegeria sp. HKCCE4148 TaxID=2794829 RepID=UPI001AEB4BBA|nr:hypothetical protein [Ruegeria sp. HKCCE4148]
MVHQSKLSETELGKEWIRGQAKHLGVSRRRFDALAAQLDAIDLSDPGILERYLIKQLSFVASALPEPVAIYFDNDFESADFFQHSRLRTSNGKTPLRASGLARSYGPGIRQNSVTEIFIKVLENLHRTRRSWPFRPTPDELRLSKCRSILLVGSELFEPDFDQQLLPSANLRVSRLMNSLLKSPSVKSWRSYGLLRSAVPFCPLGYGTSFLWRHRLKELEESAGLSGQSLEYANAIVVLGGHNHGIQSSLGALRNVIAKSTKISGCTGKPSADNRAQRVIDLNFLLGTLEAAISDGRSSPPTQTSSATRALPHHIVVSPIPSETAYKLRSQLTSLQSYIADMLLELPVETRIRVQSAITRFLFELSMDQAPKCENQGKPQLAEQSLGPSMGEEIREIWNAYAQLDHTTKVEARLRPKEPSSEFVPTRAALGELYR